MRRILPLVCGVLLCASVSYAQNPCTAALSTGVVVSANSEIFATLINHTTVVSGIAIVDTYLFGIYPASMDATLPNFSPPTQVAVPKASWALVAGTPDCYHVKIAELMQIPVNIDQRGVLKARRTTTSPADSAWSVPTNPFVRLGPPAVPTGVRVTP